MLFSVSIASRGDGEPNFSARLPFVISPGHTIKLENGSTYFKVSGHECRIVLEAHQYSLTVRDFNSELEAKEFLSRAAAGLIWLGLKQPIGFRFDPCIQSVELFPEPQTISGSFVRRITEPKGWTQIDGQYNSDQTIVRPEHKRLIAWTMGQLSVRQDIVPSFVAGGIDEAFRFGRPEMIFQRPKLRLAAEFYMSSHFESTPAASFLSRFTTLEILVPDVPVHASLHQMLDNFIGTVREESQKNRKQEDIRKEFDSVLTRLTHIRNRSIKSGLRTLIHDKLGNDSAVAAPSINLAREVSDLYDLRSELVHNGTANSTNLKEGNNRLGEIVPRLLRVLFREAAIWQE